MKMDEKCPNGLLCQAEEALLKKDGKRAMLLAGQVLDLDERCVTAWLIAMKSFQLLLPIEEYRASNEIDCAKYAIRFAGPREKYQVRQQVYRFFLNKIIEVLRRDEEVLADGRSVVSFYQRTVYFHASKAPELTMKEDRPVVEAVMSSFIYCRELFDFIPDSAVKKSAGLNHMAAQAAGQWQRTCGYLEMRFELYHRTLSQETVESCLKQYARFLRAVRNREELMKKAAPYHIYRLDQEAFISQEQGSECSG